MWETQVARATVCVCGLCVCSCVRAGGLCELRGWVVRPGNDMIRPGRGVELYGLPWCFVWCKVCVMWVAWGRIGPGCGVEGGAGWGA